ncbi:hypothetical protein SCMU_11330 [Sinomonas cyclohexanicum]|uniref:BIG2 domain-containing protein n=1 Tax=Sinomonas cyclohexanicum TaxID=322009 RepID=A0ABM7PSS6_SINCY|nr:Ig-like domain-containing protein [Corynebacterium cyclohexanicum]BCT75291.1 hypothetical protein SCMU_11330 [Corynebacterium cyclohexanicum]
MNDELRERLYLEARALAERHPADLGAAMDRGQSRARARVIALSVIATVAILAAATALVVVRLLGLGGPQRPSASVIGVTVVASDTKLAPGAQLQLGATAALSDGGARNLHEGVAWSTSDPGVLTVDGAGHATGVAAGSASVTAVFGGFSGSLALAVVPGYTPTPRPSVTVRELRVDPGSTSVRAGLTTTFSAQLILSDDSAVPPGQLTWTSSDTTVATVSPSGVVTGVAPGSALLTAKGNDYFGTTYEGFALVTVTPPEVVRVVISPAAVPVLSAGDKRVKLTATVTYTTGVSEAVQAVSWSSENGEVVSMDDVGNAYPQKSGTSAIRASYGGVTSQPVTITVR